MIRIGFTRSFAQMPHWSGLGLPPALKSLPEESPMKLSCHYRPIGRAPGLHRVLYGTVVLLALAGCASQNAPEVAAVPAAAPVEPTLPSAYRAEELVGRWGFASYHKPEDRARTESAAKQCNQPYVIRAGQSGGVIMHLADQNQPQELALKGSRSGKNYVGLASDPPGGPSDREIESFDGREIFMRWMDPEVQGRYGTSVYVRCGAEGPPKKRAVSRR
jgi:hypothetical protein